MTAPALAAHRFVCCCLLGAALGVYYEFLRPLRPRYTLAADALFLTGCVWVWLIMSFRVCRGDLRLGYSAGLLAGGIVWDLAFSSLIAPIFSGFWKFVRAILGFALLPAKKFSEFAKILFASAKKWVTIKWNHRREKRRKRRGEPIGTETQGKSDFPVRLAGTEDHRGSAYRILYGGAGSSEVGTHRHSGADRRAAGRGRRSGTSEQRAGGKNWRAGLGEERRGYRKKRAGAG